MVYTALALCVLSAVLIGPVASALTSARWVEREPRAALVLWQALGLASGLALVQSALVVALAPMGDNLPAAIHRWLSSVSAGDPRADMPITHVVLLGAALALLGWLWGVTAHSAWVMWRARSRHRDLVDLVAEPHAPDVQVIEHSRVAAYCLPGFASRVVVTSEAVRVLDDAELAAVLAHERAHVSERHDLVVLPFIAWAAALPMVRGADQARAAVAGLVEFVADDRACVGNDRRVVAAALARCGIAGGPVPAGAFAVGGAVVRRVRRLLEPARPAARIRWTARAAALTVVLLPVLALFIN